MSKTIRYAMARDLDGLGLEPWERRHLSHWMTVASATVVVAADDVGGDYAPFTWVVIKDGQVMFARGCPHRAAECVLWAVAQRTSFSQRSGLPADR